MADIESMLNRWQSAGVLDAEAAARIRAHESQQSGPAGLHWQRASWQGMTALTLGAILLACGVVLFVSAHWDQLGPGARYTLVMAMVAVFHLAGAWARKDFHGLSTALHAVGTVSAGAAIALVGQIFNIQEHWPAAILLWALAALAGWALLRDQAQQTLALLLVPAWMFSEQSFYLNGHIGENVYLGRALVTWAMLYLTVFLGSRRKAVQGILFAVAAIAAVYGTVLILGGWLVWSPEQTLAPFGARVWAWTVIAVLPLGVAAFRGHKGLIPIAAALAYAIALPWCRHNWTEKIVSGSYHGTFNGSDPNLAAHALVVAFAVFVCWWGVRQDSRALVNLGILGFAIAVGWFYFSDIFDEVGRSLGLIGLGILFLAGGWALEKTRRRILARMDSAEPSGLKAAGEAQ
jgi:hypothetical protein